MSVVEGDIEKSRRYYNGNVREQNTLIESFPSNLIANSFGFVKAVLFELEDQSQRNAPSVKFA